MKTKPKDLAALYTLRMDYSPKEFETLEAELTQQYSEKCEVVKRFVRNNVPVGAECRWYNEGDFYIEWKRRGWSTEVSLQFDVDTNRATISWSSTSRSVSEALAAVTNYDRAVRFAAELESFSRNI